MSKNCKDYIDARARRIAVHAGLDPEAAVLSLRSITNISQVLAAATGELNTTTIEDDNGGDVDGNRWRLQGQGGKHWVLVAMVSCEPANAAGATWGYKNFVFNDNPINKLSFQGSLEDRSNDAVFWGQEAVKSGLDPFPWQDLPAFGPNDTLDVVAFNATAGLVVCGVQFWIMPVPVEYTPIGSTVHDCKPCPAGRRY